MSEPSDTYPKRVVTIEVATYEDDGCCYTLIYPDGKRVLLGDAEDNYAELAGIIDDEYDKTPPEERAIPPCPGCGGQREHDGLGGYACYFCGR